MEGTETSESIKLKLSEYGIHLNAVEEALVAAPDNPELLSIKADIEEVVAVFSELLRFKTGVQSPPAELRDELLNRSVQLHIDGDVVVGRVVDSKVVDDLGVLCVLFPCEDVPRELSRARANVLPMQSLSDFPLKSSCEAVFDDDGLWYPATVIRYVGGTEICVSFADWHEDGVVSLDRIRVPRKSKITEVKEIITPGGYRLPESLQIKSSDSQKVKDVKKRRGNEIKKQQRKDRVEQTYKDKQSNWAKHLKRNAGKASALTQSTRTPSARRR
ncbi:MAG: uncharacterized protein KVP18_003065 [Porospora cf. gigantea A]|uniref:uncharacterized protein n=1 Tax=Porospora cf. gigantea A TaxID=2853593 RepID=UPI0035597AED|nr:MAG: hypothetical protein KVP18_003065 [Porospora cf. gigantea A]